MKISKQRTSGWLRLLYSATLLLSLSVIQLAQSLPQIPAPTGHVNDFARVLDEQTRQRLENILTNVKLKTGIEFDIATVESTGGQDIFDFSRLLAQEWNVGARTTAKKSLLLVLSVNEKTSFTQFSRSVQKDLPEGVLGEMGQLMRGLVAAGRFSEGLNAGVQHFVLELGEKLAFKTDDFDKAPQQVATVSPATPAPDNSATRPTDEAAPAISSSASSQVRPATVRASAPRGSVAATFTKKPTTADDDAESEEVELTLTKPLEERIVLLKAFLGEHPESKSKARAMELLVSARARLGDERLKKGDTTGGVEQLMQAIADAPTTASEQLFTGVIAQIPLNLYLRGERPVAARAAQNIETKFGSDPKRLVALSGFYIATEQGTEAIRVTTQAVQLAPELAEAHLGLGRALHISLRLEEAIAEYKRAYELDPNMKAARRGLADLTRAFGKPEEALALYRKQLEVEPADKAARTGLILSLFDLGRTAEGKEELDKALKSDPRNQNLLAGAAYWYAAHNDSEVAVKLATQAVQLEPRYTWSQVALARALAAQRKPLEAERALRFARQYGKFPTLDYELATALVSAALYEEAAEVLMPAFSWKDGQIETRLGGQAAARSASFLELLAPERRASIYQSAPADTENNAKLLKSLLVFTTLLNPELNGGTINEDGAIAAAKEFASGDDPARVHRQLYAASRLLQRGVGFQTAYELAEAARNSADAGMTVPGVTLAVQADEFRSIRARAIAQGGTPDIPEAPRNVLSNLLRGRIEDISGWALFNQDKVDEAVEHLRRAVTILPPGTPAARASLWHLGAALERQDKKTEALSNYIKSYNSGDPDAGRRAVIEQLYRKINGSLDGLDERIGTGATQVSAQSPATADPVPTSPAATSTPPSESPTPEPSPTQAPASDTTAEPSAGSPAATPAATVPTAEPKPETPAPAAPSSLATSPVERLDKPARSTVSITGRVKDANGNAIANVVVVLISPQGTVLASTTDEQGKYSFTVVPSSATHSYRLIPSKDGFSFEPVDKVLPVVSDDQKELDFVGNPVKQSVRLR